MTTHITRDGETVATVADENAAVVWIHQHCSYSVDHALTHEGYAFVEVPEDHQIRNPIKRTCFYVSPDSYVEGKGFVPSVVTEGEPGHAPLSGSGDFAEPWYWGKTYEEARRVVARENANRGLTEEEVSDIVLSSMTAPADNPTT